MDARSNSRAALGMLFGAIVGCGRPTPVESGPASGRYEVADSSRLPDLVRGLKSPSAATRARVAAGLGSLGAAAKPAVPDLIAALKDRDVPVRAAAAYALGQIGPEAREAAPALKELAKRPATREVATKALGLIGR